LNESKGGEATSAKGNGNTKRQAPVILQPEVVHFRHEKWLLESKSATKTMRKYILHSSAVLECTAWFQTCK
jgi:hypothetical protein